MDVIEQLKRMRFDDYNPTKLQASLEAVFKQPENFKVYQEALRRNCYINIREKIYFDVNINLQIEKNNKTTLEQFVLTVKDTNQSGELLCLELVIAGQSIDNVTVIIRKNDMMHKNKDIIKMVKTCFSFYDNDYRFFKDYD